MYFLCSVIKLVHCQFWAEHLSGLGKGPHPMFSALGCNVSDIIMKAWRCHIARTMLRPPECGTSIEIPQLMLPSSFVPKFPVAAAQEKRRGQPNEKGSFHIDVVKTATCL